MHIFYGILFSISIYFIFHIKNFSGFLPLLFCALHGGFSGAIYWHLAWNENK